MMNRVLISDSNKTYMKPEKAQNQNIMKKYILPILYMAIVSACSNKAEKSSMESKEGLTKKVETITVSYQNAPQALTLPDRKSVV